MITTYISALTPWKHHDDYFVRPVPVTIEHPRITTFDPQAFRTVLKEYDKYVREVSERVKQLAQTKYDTDKTLRSFEHESFQFCVFQDTLKAAVELYYINNVKTYKDLNDTKLRAFLESLEEDKNRRKPVSETSKIVYSGPSMSTSILDARARMQKLIIAYRSL